MSIEYIRTLATPTANNANGAFHKGKHYILLDYDEFGNHAVGKVKSEVTGHACTVLFKLPCAHLEQEGTWKRVHQVRVN